MGRPRKHRPYESRPFPGGGMFGPRLGGPNAPPPAGPRDWLVWTLGDEPLRGLEGVRELKKYLVEAEGRHVRAARALGISWRIIAFYLGPRYQAVHERWGPRNQGDTME
jgi:hypothetical protein